MPHIEIVHKGNLLHQIPILLSPTLAYMLYVVGKIRKQITPREEQCGAFHSSDFRTKIITLQNYRRAFYLSYHGLQQGKVFLITDCQSRR